jgi:hypothetical protein
MAYPFYRMFRTGPVQRLFEPGPYLVRRRSKFNRCGVVCRGFYSCPCLSYQLRLDAGTQFARFYRDNRLSFRGRLFAKRKHEAGCALVRGG